MNIYQIKSWGLGFPEKIKERFLGTADKKRLLENFFSLSFLQGANYLLPLITLPYLVRVLGPEKYGLIAFAQAFTAYFQILTDYGFNLSATREISINRENEEKISEIFSSVMVIKFGLLILSFIIMSSIVFAFEKFRRDWLIYFLTFGMVVGQTLFPVWFFQGMERMKYITFLNITAKLIFTISIFIFIRNASDYIYVPLINSLGSMVAGLLALRIVFKDFGVSFTIPDLDAVKHQLKEGWHIFVSMIAISLYTTSRIFLVGIFTNNTITGYYAIAEKLMNIIQTFPLVPLLQTMYPRLSAIYSESKRGAYDIMRKFQNFTTFFYLFIVLILYYLSEIVVSLVAGAPYKETVITFRTLLLAMFFINANAFRVQFLLVSGHDEIYSKIHILMGLLGLLLLIFGTYFCSYVGAASSVVLIEFFVMIVTMKSIKNLKITCLRN